MSLTNVKNPGNPLWNCCKAKPFSVVEYDDGSANVVCLSCGASFARQHGRGRVTTLPADWTPTTIGEKALQLAEAIQSYYWDVATSEDQDIAGGSTETYRNAHAALLAGYKAAWPHLDPQAIYEVWLDCNESAAYCADIVEGRFTSETRDGERIIRIDYVEQEVWLDESGEIVTAETHDNGGCNGCDQDPWTDKFHYGDCPTLGRKVVYVGVVD